MFCHYCLFCHAYAAYFRYCLLHYYAAYCCCHVAIADAAADADAAFSLPLCHAAYAMLIFAADDGALTPIFISPYAAFFFFAMLPCARVAMSFCH